MTKLFSAAAAALTIFAGASAQAEQLKMVSRTIVYHTQDVAYPAGAAKMLNRIEFVARQICSYNSDIMRHGDAKSRACAAQAVARAVDAMAAPLVTAAHAAHAARPPAVAVASR